MNINKQISVELNIAENYVNNIVELLGEGNTIPFIARYRKEMHGALDDQVIRQLADRHQYLTNLANRKQEVQTAIVGQDKWTDELAVQLENATTMAQVEDIYRPYKAKKKTRASVAIACGLEPLADYIMAQQGTYDSTTANQYINAELGIDTADKAIQGASDIIAERMSDNADNRGNLRTLLHDHAKIVVKASAKAPEDKIKTFEGYSDHSEQLANMPSHRVLAINRGEKEDCLVVTIEDLADKAVDSICRQFITNESYRPLLTTIACDSYSRLIYPSIARELRTTLTDNANEQAIAMFDSNLRPLLMQPPLKGKTIMGLDPGYRTGCKVAVIDSFGNVLAHNVIYPTHTNRIPEAEQVVISLAVKHKVDVISIGNGTASKETEIFVSNLLPKCPQKLQYTITNEAGASIYSASKLAAEEFPQYDLTIRSAISIARRVQDPLAELIKIDVAGIGVGQYQHDMPQKRLTQVLDGVVEDCVNSVGVDLNTASYALLSHVSGLNMGIAKNIVTYRATKSFGSRSELLKVAKLGNKAYEQCAGFLRIPEAKNVLDNTGVHPESYKAAKALLDMFGYSDSDVTLGKLNLNEDISKEGGTATVAAKLDIGVPTLADIVAELSKPGRDIRDTLPQPVLRAELLDIKNLTVGMTLTGVVRNVIDFGAFIDIGVHQDGLVHLSEISDSYIKHASQVLKVGDNVTVRVIGVDLDKNRIALSMKDPNAPKPTKKPQGDNSNKPRGNGNKANGNGRPNGNKGNYNQNKPKPPVDNYDDKLAQLMAKYKKH